MSDDHVLPEEPSPAAGTPAPGPPAPRRRFLRRALLLGGAGLALGVAGLGTAVAFRVRRGGTSTAPLVTLRDCRVAVPSTTPRLVIARGPSPEVNVRAALDRLGGMGAFVGHDDVVLIKPNIGWERTPAQAANTDPEVVAALTRACMEAGAREVIVTDIPCTDQDIAFRRSGIADAARKAGANVLMPQDAARGSLVIPGKSGAWTTLEAYARATKVINVPVAKHHGKPKLTAGLKNWFGLVEHDRVLFHAGLSESIVALASLMRPTLTVIDCTRVLLRNGPSGGNLADVKRLDTIAMGLDPVATDAWAAEQIGFRAAQIEYLTLAEQRGLGTTDFRSLSPIELST
jgi:uncharacterized protein (DUF362 family)